MKWKPFDIVVLRRDVQSHGLHEGDLGAVVEVYPPSAVEVEFVNASGNTVTVVTLDASAVRSVNDAA